MFGGNRNGKGVIGISLLPKSRLFYPHPDEHPKRPIVNDSLFYDYVQLLYCLGVVLPELGHETVPLEDVQWLHEFMKNGSGDGTGIAFEKAVFMLRRKHYPFHYDPHPWIAGTCTHCSVQLFRLRLSPSKAEKSNMSEKGCLESLKNSLIF